MQARRPKPLGRRESGTRWEKVAESFLRSRGLKLLKRNFTSRFGEIDLVMEDRGTLVFIEVKFRHRTQHGSGAEAVTVQKQAKISRTAAWYLAKHPYRAEQACRFDVISVTDGNADEEIEWIKAAFYAK